MFHRESIQPRRRQRLLACAAAFVPGLALAQSGLGDTQTKFCTFLTNITQLLNIGSIGIVTIAIIFAGFQIAFAHKRITDVAPIFIGAVLIGAAAQIATMLIGSGNTCTP